MKIPTWKHILPLLGIALLFVLLLSNRTSVAPVAAADGAASPQTMPGRFLTGPNDGDPVQIALDYLVSSAPQYNLTASDVSDIVVTSSYLSKHNGVTHVHTRQRINGIEINGAVANVNVAQDGSIISMGSRYISDAASLINAAIPARDAMTAVEYAADVLQLPLLEPLTIDLTKGGVMQEGVVSSGGISRDPIPVKLMYQPDVSGLLRLSWEMIIYELDASHWWHLWIDADTGEILDRYDFVTHDHFGVENAPAGSLSNAESADSQTTTRAVDGTYNVFPQPVESPIHGERAIVTDPFDLVASPYGWHDVDGVAGAEYTVTRGNNVHAYQDLLVPNFPLPLSDAEGGEELNFDFPYNGTDQLFLLYKDAAVTNLFYWSNIIHDVYYQYGFDEVAGNFQANNYGRGGVGGDYVFAEAQDGSGTDNANFATPVDGSNPRMQMYVWALSDPGTIIDGDFDSGIIAHEYGHGISIRLTGGPADVGCMNHAEREGEGWSDWLGLVLTTKPEHTATTNRGVGAFALNQPPDGPGIRAFPYTTDMNVNPQTYNDTNSAAVPHGVGSVWATMIWDLYWAYVDKYGYDADVYNAAGTAGNQRAIQLIFDGMKMQVCDPTFTEARDAILTAEQVLTGGENECMIWDVFARRGLGFSADSGDRNSATDANEAFDIPPHCISEFDLETAPLSICAPANGITPVNVTTLNGFGGTITLSAENLPTNATATFDPAAVIGLPATSNLTIGNTGNVAAGTYFVDVVGTAITTTASTELKLNIADDVPAVATAATPTDGAVISSLTPLFTWQAAAQASTYKIELATDAAFSNIVAMKDGIQATSYTLETPLAEGQTIYWRVTANNDCGVGQPSAPAAFTVSNSSCTTYDSLLPIPIVGSIGGTSTISVGDDVRITDINIHNATGVYDSLDSLNWLLTSPSGSGVTLFNATTLCSGYSGNDLSFDFGFDDQATTKIKDATCPPTAGDNYQPNESLDAFNQEMSAGTWSLQMADQFINHAGVLSSWSLEVCTAGSADFSDLATSYGIASHTGTGALKIGDAWDSDNSSAASQDDDTDDGIAFDSTLEAGEAFAMTVDVSGAAGAGVWVASWFDWNNDGDFADAGEAMFDEAGSISAVVLNGSVPSDAILGETVNYRVRVYDSSGDPTASESGSSDNGEVTDGATASVPTTPTVTSLQSFETGHGNMTTVLLLISALLLGLVAVRIGRRKA